MRYWISWTQPAGDYRPKWTPPGPAVLGWWKTGETWDRKNDGDPLIDVVNLCAVVQCDTQGSAYAAILLDWPDMINWRFFEEKPADWAPNEDRFPREGWIGKRLAEPDSHRTSNAEVKNNQ
jgi:hypothetical protein